MSRYDRKRYQDVAHILAISNDLDEATKRFGDMFNEDSDHFNRNAFEKKIRSEKERLTRGG